ncbi:hypothetical protein ACEQPO_14835 [Bacillus sp. SL00103]
MDDLKQFRQWGSKTPGHPELDIQGRRCHNRSFRTGIRHGSCEVICRKTPCGNVIIKTTLMCCRSLYIQHLRRWRLNGGDFLKSLPCWSFRLRTFNCSL